MDSTDMMSVLPICLANDSYSGNADGGEGEDGKLLRLALPEQICHACNFPIADRYLYRVFNDFFHENCLRCVSCDKLLTSVGTTCFTKNGLILCKDDHLNFFLPKCVRCRQPLAPNEMVQKSRNLIFHTNCFQCVYCSQHLKTGDQYFCIDGQVVCQNDYNYLLSGHLPHAGNLGELSFQLPPPIPPFFADLDPHLQLHSHRGSKKTPKRPRTILNSSQRKAFKIAFEKGPKPSKKVREQLAKDTGLSVRVVQVWFQNQRAKIKKIQRKQEVTGNSSQHTESTAANDAPSSLDDSDLKSPLSIKSIDDSDSEDVEVDSGRSSATIQRQSSTSSLFSNSLSADIQEKDPIDKLYHMQNTYFAYA